MQKRSRSEKIVFPVVWAVFLLYAFSLLYPFVWMFLNSLKTQNDFTLDIFGLPPTWHFSNWIDALLYNYRDFNVITMTLNSIFITVVVVALQIFFYSVSSYIMAKYRFFGRAFLYSLIIVLMIMPAVGTTVATYRLLRAVGLYNTHVGIFLLQSSGLTGVGFLMCYAFYKNLSWSYAEAAFMDGANDTTVYFRIMLPQAVPVLFSLAVLQVLTVWNDFFTPYMYLSKYPTLAVGLNELNTNIRYIGNYPLLFSVMFISVLPVLLLFVAFQKTIMDNTMAGGLKG